MGGRLRIPLAAGGADPLAELSRGLQALDAEAAARLCGVAEEHRPLKTTVSLCPACLAHVPALVFASGGRVLMARRCEAHGTSRALLESDERWYALSSKDRRGRRFAEDRLVVTPPYEGCCGTGASCGSPGGATDQMANKTCTILVEVTDACNLSCPVCYSDAKGERGLDLASFQRYLARLIEAKGGLDSVQLTGGEALLHPQIWDMLRWLHAQEGVKKVYLPTNGILVARPGAAERLAALRDKLMVLLQCDARDDGANEALRGARLARVRSDALAALERHGIFVQLTMTVAAGVNEGDVGWVVDLGLRHRNVKVVAIQPATTSGRYEVAVDPMARATLSDMVKAVVAQAHGPVDLPDFVPIPCSHPNCGWITLFVRRFGIVANVMKHVDVGRVMDRVAYRTMLSTSQLREAVGPSGPLWRRAVARLVRPLVRSTDMFTVAIKPFMDRYTYDQDRIDACCHHTMDTSGRPVSFCEYNALLRPRDGWAALPRLAELAGSRDA